MLHDLEFIHNTATCSCAECTDLLGDPDECTHLHNYRQTLTALDQILARLTRTTGPIALTAKENEQAAMVMNRHTVLNYLDLFPGETIHTIEDQPRTIRARVLEDGHGILDIGTLRFTTRPVHQIIADLCDLLACEAIDPWSVPRWVLDLTEDAAEFLHHVTGLRNREGHETTWTDLLPLLDLTGPERDDLINSF